MQKPWGNGGAFKPVASRHIAHHNTALNRFPSLHQPQAKVMLRLMFPATLLSINTILSSITIVKLNKLLTELRTLGYAVPAQISGGAA